MYNPEEELKEFPCTFTLVPASKVTHERYKHLENNLREDLLNRDCPDDEETIWNKNLLAWVMFCLGEREKSFEKSHENVGATNEKKITALGNFVYISFRMGHTLKSEKAMKKLRALKTQENFQTLMTEALAEQAYALSRLGGLKNPLKSKELYKTCIEKFPNNYLWKYGLGLVCRRLTKMDLSISSVENTDMTELTEECVKLLFDVAEHAHDNYLKGLAYSQLVPIRQYNSQRQHDSLFKDLTLPKLCDKALEYGRINPVVLTQCGKSLKGLNIDDAIALLEASLVLRKDNTAYNHLGLCYQRKAVMMVKGTYRSKDSLLTINISQGETIISYTKKHTFQNKTAKTTEFQRTSKQSQFQNEVLKRSGIQGASSSHSRFQIEGPKHLEYHSATSRKSQFQNKAWSYRKDKSTYSVGSLHTFLYNECIMLAAEDELVKEAIECFKKAKEMSYGENIAATICLGKIYSITGQYEDALAQFNQVIDRNDDTALVSLIDAYKEAAKCLKYLSKNSENRKLLEEEAKECAAKVISLAVDLVAKNPNYKDFEKLIADSINIFTEDIAPIRKEVWSNKSKDDSGVPDNMGVVLKKLNSYLKSGHIEKALAYLKYQSTKSFFVKETSSSEIRDMCTNIYTRAAWSRLKKLSPDCKRAFQKLFEMKYGHWKGMVSKMEEEGGFNKHDVLIINDSETNYGHCLCKTLSRNLLLVLNIVFGLETFHHLELTDDQGLISEELNPQSLLKFTLIVIIVEGPISENYRRELKTLSQLNGPKIIVNCGMIHECPDTLDGGTFVYLNAWSGPLTKLLTTTMEEEEFGSKQYEQSRLFLKRIVEQLFDGSPDAVMRLFCILVGEDFDEHRQHWAIDSMSTATPDLSA